MSLFPHRYDFLYADHPTPGQRPSWKTEHRYPLGDRLINQGDQLLGVRFGSTTAYALLDIDTTSQYHPQQDLQGIERILGALEPLGLLSYIACTSSYSGGLHLYFPFNAPQSSQRLAHAMKGLLQQAGLPLAAGQLELFPNPRPYSHGKALFNGHRLPLQTGSYLLNSNLHPIWTSQERFVDQWRYCVAQNDVTATVLRRVLKQQRRRYIVSGKANKFLNDLNADIEPGWTGASQTNYILGRIALRSYVFGHVLSGKPPLLGQALVEEIVAIARALPGYDDWCQHKHEIYERSVDWARCVESSKYYPYGLSQKPAESTTEKRDWNQEQFSRTAEKIKAAVQHLSQQELPEGATARFKALTACGIGGGSLYRHKKLWHPDHLNSDCRQSAIDSSLMEEVVDPKSDLENSQGTSVEENSSSVQSNKAAAEPQAKLTSLLPSLAGNPAVGKGLDRLDQLLICGNPYLGKVSSAVRSLFPQLPYQACFLERWRSQQRTSTG